MSGSQQKKVRLQQRAEGAEKRQVRHKKASEKAKKSRRNTTVTCIITGILVLSIILLSSNLFYANFDAVKVGNVGYSASEVSFIYNTTYNNFIKQNSSYLSMMGLDTTKSLRTQKYSEDLTWHQFFLDNAVTQLQSTTMLWSEAQAAGFELSEDDQKALDANIASLDSEAKANNFSSTDKFIASNYGKGLNKKSVSRIMERAFIANAYAQEKANSFTYTDTELEENYSENKDDYDTYSFLYSFVSGTPDAESDESSEDAIANAKETADAFVKDIESQEDFEKKVLSKTQAEAVKSNSAGSKLSANYAEWLKDSARKSGDTTVVEADGGYYALYFIERGDNNYNTVNVRHILIKAEADENGAYTDEAKAKAKETAQEILNTWEDGDATEDSFSELAAERSQDPGSASNGGLYEEVSQGTMVEEFNDWCFDSARKAGDTGIVYGESANYCGYHVMYYAGQGDLYRDIVSENSLRNTDYSEWNTETLENYPVKTTFFTFFVR